MTILITGGAGFIGTRLVASLDKHSDIVVVDNLHEQVHGPGALLPSSTAHRHYVFGDVTDAAMWDALLHRTTPSTVVHLAAETGTGQSLHEASRHTNVNVNGTAVMLDAFSRHGKVPSAIVLSSSRAVYGEGKWKDDDTGQSFYGEPRVAARLDAAEWLPMGRGGQTGSPLPHSAESTEPRPSNVYAATKLAQENILTAWCASMATSLSILRLQNVYGRGQALRNPYTGVLTAFARQILKREEVDVYEGGGIIRDFVHVSDVVAAMRAAINNPADISRRRLIDVGSGEPGTLEHFASVLTGLAEGAVYTTSGNYRLGDVRAAWADNSAAERQLSYRPEVDFREGAAELLAWAEQEVNRGQ